MIFATVAILFTAVLRVHGLAINNTPGLSVRQSDTCSYTCPPTDTAGDALGLDDTDVDEAFICFYGAVSGMPGYYHYDCLYDESTGQLVASQSTANCPPAAQPVNGPYTCPAYDTDGDALGSNDTDVDGAFICFYDEAPDQPGWYSYECTYDSTTGILDDDGESVGPCPAYASCQ